MAGQEQVSRSSRPQDELAEQQDVRPSAGSAVNDADVDDILDEIDLVLEQNAEEFVKSFVQKGGQ